MADDRGNEGVLDWVGNVIASAAEAVMRDGTIAAAGRQGIDELSMLTKAFPDSIQREEMGSIWNPTPGEIAASRDLSSGAEVTPGRDAADQERDLGR